MADAAPTTDDEPAPLTPGSTTAVPAASTKKEDLALVKMHEIVDSFLARPDSGPFREPVDYVGEFVSYHETPERSSRFLNLIRVGIGRLSGNC